MIKPYCFVEWVYVLSCRLTSGPLWLGIYLFLWWFLLALFWLFVLHWRYELPCQDKLPEFHYTPILGCIRVLWLVFHPLGLGLDKVLFMFANSQCLLKISAGLDFPSFQLNWRYPAAMASLTLWYDANVDFFDRLDVGILALSTTDLLSPNM